MNNALYVLYYCPIATFIWNSIKDFINTMIGKHIRMDMRTAILNFYHIKDEPRDRNTRALINVFLIIARKVIYILLYREDEVTKNNIKYYEFIKNIRLILKFRKICAVFLIHQINT